MTAEQESQFYTRDYNLLTLVWVSSVPPRLVQVGSDPHFKHYTYTGYILILGTYLYWTHTYTAYLLIQILFRKMFSFFNIEHIRLF